MKHQLSPDQVKRKYYLHRRLKPVLKINIKEKTISVSDEIIDKLNHTQYNLFCELKHTFNYSAQFILPEEKIIH